MRTNEASIISILPALTLLWMRHRRFPGHNSTTKFFTRVANALEPSFTDLKFYTKAPLEAVPAESASAKSKPVGVRYKTHTRVSEVNVAASLLLRRPTGLKMWRVTMGVFHVPIVKRVWGLSHGLGHRALVAGGSLRRSSFSCRELIPRVLLHYRSCRLRITGMES